MSVHAYVLIQTEVGKAADVARQVDAIDGRRRGRGRHRPLRRDRPGRGSASVDDLGRLVVSQIQRIEGITRTVTCPVVNL